MTWSCTLPRPEPGGHDDPDILAGRLWLAGATGVWVRADAVVGYFDARVDIAEVAPSGAWEPVEAVDWNATWREGLGVVRAGPFDLVPTWLADEATVEPGRVRIVMDPGQAFGSGQHDTTAGCLEALAELPLAGASVLDVGTGTGVLGIAAALRGAAAVTACDLDPIAVEVTATNAAANGVDVEAVTGSTSAVGSRTFDVVVANLLTHTLVELAAELVGAVRPGGWLVTSGIGAERAGQVVEAFAAQGLAETSVRVRGEWAVVAGRRPA